MEQVRVDAEAGTPKTAMQIATSKYRHGKKGSGAATEAAQAGTTFPEPKMRDQFVHFSVMPSAPLPPVLRRVPRVLCNNDAAFLLLQPARGSAAVRREARLDAQSGCLCS